METVQERPAIRQIRARFKASLGAIRDAWTLCLHGWKVSTVWLEQDGELRVYSIPPGCLPEIEDEEPGDESEGTWAFYDPKDWDPGVYPN